MKGAQSISTRRAYGVERICRVWDGRGPASTRDGTRRGRAPSRRRGPIGAAPDAVLVGPHSPSARSLTVLWRGVPESVGEAAGRGDPHLEGAGAAVNAGARPPGPAARGPRARPDGTRRHDHHRGPRRDVGNGHDGHGDGADSASIGAASGFDLRHDHGCSWRSITARPSASVCEELRLALLAKRTYNAVDAREIPRRPRCDATSLGWTRLRRSEYRQTRERFGDTCRQDPCRRAAGSEQTVRALRKALDPRPNLSRRSVDAEPSSTRVAEGPAETRAG